MSNKWAPKILMCLKDGRRRFTELQSVLASVTPKVLAESLRSMERDGMVLRTAYPGVPPRVEYELTALGRTLLEPLRAWCGWTEAHLPELVEAREEYERRNR
ncbi:helix-turn-helix domain-containing protein [Frankia sp. CiP3]|uniref:winged helix-turn-helix transcriptional regulator n=1 Tax=Frankia sp. CiP3 TaxID=2880971 RepID=UPI001EF6C222|nr:helix-turn-helix domain-containing protein [Frankia sp. CiP3]